MPQNRRGRGSHKRPRIQRDIAGAESSAGSQPSASQPRHIPGFFWDDERKRYFPEANRGAPDRIERQNEQREQSRIQKTEMAQKRQMDTAKDQCTAIPKILRHQRSGICDLQTDFRDAILLGNMLKTKVTIDYNNSHSVVTSLCQMGSSSSAGRRLVAIGHQNGLVSIIEPASAIDSSGSSSNDNNITDRQRMEVWNGSGITSICRVASGSFLYTALGKGASSGSFSIFRNRSAHRLCKHRLVGMSVFGACIPQLETETLTPLEVSVAHSGGASVVSVGTGGPVGVFAAKTGSDILCTTFIADSRSVFVGGGRDGHIRLFDSRIDSKRHNQHRGLFSSKNGCRHKTGVHGISSMHNGMQQFASACMDGQVNTWDVRMIRGNDVGVGSIEPAVRCLNRLSERSEIAAPCMLGFGVSNDVVAAASGDGLVRLWSASSGRLLRAAPLPAARGLCRALDLDYNPTIAASTLYLGQGANVVAYRSNI